MVGGVFARIRFGGAGAAAGAHDGQQEEQAGSFVHGFLSDLSQTSVCSALPLINTPLRIRLAP
jgi:hypothetical protein